ncbi:MAG: hypothetical protein HYT87_18890 [Nitrospirae bacterium]|nr:hypothetical protein [Nitrospirota bacterium]
MTERERDDGWTRHRREQQEAWLRLTYEQRLEWLEDAKRFCTLAIRAAAPRTKLRVRNDPRS